MKVNRIVTILCWCLILLVPMLVLGQSNEETNAQLLDFTRGDGTFESWFMEVFTKLDTMIEQRAFEASILGRAIGGFGALIYLGIIGYRMQMGSAEWDIEPMLKPFFIGFILINWGLFVNLIQYPFLKLAEPSEAIFEQIEQKADALRTSRFNKQMQVLEATIKLKAESEVREKTFGENWKTDGFISAVGTSMGNAVSDLWTPIAEYGKRLNYSLQKIMGEFLETSCLLILRVAVYFIFFIQKIWSYVLIVLGPIAFGISMIPGFDNSMNNWIAKFININLFTFIAYTIINIGQQIIMAGYQMEIDRLSRIVDREGRLINESLLLSYSASQGFISSILFPCTGYLITAVGILMTPTIADAIVSAGGSGVMTKAKAAASKAMQGAKAVGSAGASAGMAGMAGIQKLSNSFRGSSQNSQTLSSSGGVSSATGGGASGSWG